MEEVNEGNISVVTDYLEDTADDLVNITIDELEGSFIDNIMEINNR